MSETHKFRGGRGAALQERILQARHQHGEDGDRHEDQESGEASSRSGQTREEVIARMRGMRFKCHAGSRLKFMNCTLSLLLHSV